MFLLLYPFLLNYARWLSFRKTPGQIFSFRWIDNKFLTWTPLRSWQNPLKWGSDAW